MDNIDAFMQVMEMSAAAQSAVRLPLNLSEAMKVGDNRYKKELLRVGELIVNKAGKKFNFTSDFLKQMKGNFDKKVLDYVPMVFVNPENNKHNFSAKPDDYGGVVEELSVDDEENPTKLYGTFKLTEPVKEMVEHNPKFGVSVTAHPHFVDEPRNAYYGPMLLDVAATHKPKLNRLGEWEKVGVTASDEYKEYEVLDLSAEEYNVEIIEQEREEGEESMPDKVELSQEQITALLEHPDVKSAISEQVSSAVKAKDDEIATLSAEVGNIKKESYGNVVKAALSKYKNTGVPPVMVDAAEALMLSFDADERNEKIELSVGSGDSVETLNLSKTELIVKLLDEAKGFIDLSEEKGEGGSDEVELSKEQEDKAVKFLLGIAEDEEV